MVGDTHSRKLVARIRELGWGRVCCRAPQPYPGEPWALDNGAFAAWKGGKPFDAEAFAARAWAWAAKLPRFGVLPDVVGEGERSLELSLSWLSRLPPIPWYLAVQDGMTESMVAPRLAGVAGIFMGGTTTFKGTCFSWARFAHARGLLFHYARVSTADNVRRALACSADSCDSTQPLWSREHWVKFERTVFDAERQLGLEIS